MGNAIINLIIMAKNKSYLKFEGTLVGIMSDSYISSRANALMKRVNLSSPGLRGRRNIDLVANANLLSDFRFNPSDSFEAIVQAPYSAPTLNPDRDVATWLIPDFNTANLIKSPEGATHFQFILAFGAVSNYEYVSTLGEYKPLDATYNGMGTVAYSPYIPLGGMVGSDTTLTADLGLGIALPSSVVAVAAIGIIFFQDVDGLYTQFASNNSLMVATAL